MKKYDILYHYGDANENEVMETKDFASAKEAEAYAEHLNKRMDSADALAGDYYFEEEAR